MMKAQRFTGQTLRITLCDGEEAGIYYALWRPDEIGITKACDITPILQSGLCKLINEPEKYEALNSKNGWGLYEHFVPFVWKYLEACRKNPDANVSVSR